MEIIVKVKEMEKFTSFMVDVKGKRYFANLSDDAKDIFDEEVSKICGEDAVTIDGQYIFTLASKNDMNFYTDKNGKIKAYIRNIEKVEQLLQKYDVLLPKKRNYYIETNYSHYIHAHHKEPLDKTREIIEKSYPAYLTAFDKVMKSRKAHMFNMFIMKADAFDSYCNFMFGVLEKLENEIDISDYSVQEARVFGYISELLMDVWLYTTNESYKEIPWGQIGPKQLVKKAISFVNRKFGIGKKQTHF